jgi:hypothetical protein
LQSAHPETKAKYIPTHDLFPVRLKQQKDPCADVSGLKMRADIIHAIKFHTNARKCTASGVVCPLSHLDIACCVPPSPRAASRFDVWNLGHPRLTALLQQLFVEIHRPHLVFTIPKRNRNIKRDSKNIPKTFEIFFLEVGFLFSCSGQAKQNDHHADKA